VVSKLKVTQEIFALQVITFGRAIVPKTFSAANNLPSFWIIKSLIDENLSLLVPFERRVTLVCFTAGKT
jgi:hypothetical protein